MKTIIAILFLILVVILSSSCSSRPAQGPVRAAATETPAPLAIETAIAEKRMVERVIPATGALFADESVNVSAEVPGRVESIRVDFGQRVRKGDVIAELDRRELSLQVERSRASLSQALARIGLGLKDQDTTPETTPAIRQALAQYEDAKSKFESAEKLYKTGDIARERFYELEKTLNARQAALDSARLELHTQLANIQALRAELRLAEKRLADTVVRAPFDAAVSEKLVAPGQYIKENTPIVTLVKTHPLRLRFDVPETVAQGVKVGTTLTFTTDAAPGEEFRAVVRELNPSLEPRSRTLSAEARLSENYPQLKPGMFVQVRVVAARQFEVVAVPKSAVYTIAGLSKLFTVSGDTVVEHRISTGMELGDWIEVPAEQVRPGDVVAVSGLPQLVNGARVKPTDKG